MRWLSFKNTTGETVPPYATLAPSGSVSNSGSISLTINKPSVDKPDCVMFNGPIQVPDGEYGKCTLDFPLYARSSTGGTLSPNPGSWDLTSDDCGPFCTVSSSGQYVRIDQKLRHITGVGEGC